MVAADIDGRGSIDLDNWYRRYGPMVFRRCRQLLRDEQLAEEAMQEVFVNLIRSSDSLTDRAPSSLLWQMSTNTCLNMLRSDRRRPEAAEGELVERIATVTDFEGGNIARDLLDKLFRRQKPGTGLIAVLHYLDGMTLEEVAHEVGMSVSGVRRRLAEIKARLEKTGGVS